MIDIKNYFNNIDLPDFIRNELEKDDWYLIFTRLKDLLKANIKPELKTNQETLKVKGLVYIGENCVIGDYVVIEGPVYIGNDVEIAPGAYIRPGTFIGNGCSVGHAAEVKNSIMMNESKVANHTFLGDSILGAKGRLGGHAETQNRRFDQQEISLNNNGQEVKTGLDKYGAIIGDGSRLGGGVFTPPGALIGKKNFIVHGFRMDNYIPSNSYVRTSASYEAKDNSFTGELNNKYRVIETK